MIQTLRAGGTQHPAEIINALASALIPVGGVRNAPNSTNLQVVASDTPDMDVHVSFGLGFIPQADGLQAFPIWVHTAPEDITIASNGSGNPRIDAIIAYIDKSATPDAQVTNVAKITRVAGTASASPIAPTDEEIQTAIGSANPFIRLADVRVNSGATEITTANITDRREDYQVTLYNPLIQGHKSNWVQLTDGANITVDLRLGNKFYVTIAGNRTFVLANAEAGKTFEIRIKQDATGGRAISSWFGAPYTVLWQDGVTPTLTPTANKVDKFGFEVQADGTTIDGTIISQNH